MSWIITDIFGWSSARTCKEIHCLKSMMNWVNGAQRKTRSNKMNHSNFLYYKNASNSGNLWRIDRHWRLSNIFTFADMHKVKTRTYILCIKSRWNELVVRDLASLGWAAPHKPDGPQQKSSAARAPCFTRSSSGIFNWINEDSVWHFRYCYLVGVQDY